MSNAELARDWLSNMRALSFSDAREKSLAALLARARLEGAKAARDAMTSVPNGYSIFPVNELINALEQAAGGSVAGGEK